MSPTFKRINLYRTVHVLRRSSLELEGRRSLDPIDREKWVLARNLNMMSSLNSPFSLEGLMSSEIE